MTTLLLVRHASTDHVGRVLSGWMDGVLLNAQGRAEAQALAARLGPLPLAAVYTSPLERARETAAVVAAPHRLSPALAEALGEVRFGSATGKTFAELASDPAWQRWNVFRSGARLPGGEMMGEVQARALAELQRIALAHADQQVVVVSHADVIKAVVAHALGSPLDLMQRIEIAPASVTTLALDAGGVRVLGVNGRA